MQFSLPLAGWGLRPRGRTGAGQPQPSAGWGRAGRRLGFARARGLRGVWQGVRRGRPRSGCTEPASDVQLMFDPSRDLCLRLAPRDCPGQSKLGLRSGRVRAHPGMEKRGGGPVGTLPAPGPHLALSQGLPLPLCWSRTCVSKAGVTLGARG